MAKGSLRERGKNKWQLEVDLGVQPDSKTGTMKRKKKYKTVQANGVREAQKLLTKFVSEVTSSSYFEPEKMMFNEFVLNEWMPKYATKHLAKTTLATYKGILERRILPAFNNLRIDQIKPLHILSFLDNLSEEGMRSDGKSGTLSSNSIQYHYRILRNVFNRAVEWKIIDQNPLTSIKKPKVTQKDVSVYDENEVYQVIAALEKEPLHWQLIIKLAITTGLRRSEILGIEPNHIDFDEGILSIKQAVTYTKEHGYIIGQTKTKSSRRSISLPEGLLKDFKKLKQIKNTERMAAEELWHNGDYFLLFSDWQGKPFNPSSVTTWWKRFIERHNLPKVTLHGLRHTSATFLINKGVHAKVIADRLGHSDIRVTMNTYGHVLKSADKAASKEFDNLINQKA